MQKVLLSIKDLNVNFQVRGHDLSVVRNVSLDLYENEVLAIVGESGSGKSVLMRAISGMLEENGKITTGRITLEDSDINKIYIKRTHIVERYIKKINDYLNDIYKLSYGSKLYKEIVRLEAENIDIYQINDLKNKYNEVINQKLSNDVLNKIKILAIEIYLSVCKFKIKSSRIKRILNNLKKDLIIGTNIDDDYISSLLNKYAYRVKLISENNNEIVGSWEIDLSTIKSSNDWDMIRGSRISTVFQDPMTSLNPIITIGKQISSVIMKHQKCSITEARRRAIDLMRLVGIDNACDRYNDYPFQYSGGMRQRIVIAIALSCQPKILICDEPTTALDVTIQAQILKLLKDLQKVLGFSIIFITHDLGVVANIADRVAVMYSGNIVELGKVEEIFYDPKHPYTWALLSSLPQLAESNSELYYIKGIPPSLYKEIKGDPFAPRNPYRLMIDTIKEPPMFKITDTHFAKTWLLDNRAPKVLKPEMINNIHEKLSKLYGGI